MANEYITRQTLKVFHSIVTKLINSRFPEPKGGEPVRVMNKALDTLEKKYGHLSPQRIVDYVVSSLYPFKQRTSGWKINQVFGPKSFQRFQTRQEIVYYENKWLAGADLTRAALAELVVDRSQHPKAQYVYLPAEEQTKLRLLNSEVGYVICQTSTLGWSPLSDACAQCQFTNQCKQETQRKFPEIYRLRLQYGSEQEK